MARVICNRCKAEYEVPVSRLLLTPLHFLDKRYVRCDECGQFAWHSVLSLTDRDYDAAGRPPGRLQK